MCVRSWWWLLLLKNVDKRLLETSFTRVGIVFVPFLFFFFALRSISQAMTLSSAAQVMKTMVF